MNTHRPNRTGSDRDSGFTLIDTLLSIAVCSLVILLMFPATASLRTGSRTAQSVDNLRALATANASFAADNTDFIASFDWRALDRMYTRGGHVVQPPYDLGNGLKYIPTNTYEATQAQMCFILRFGTGRDEHHAKPIELDFNVMPQRRFLYLTMLRYLGGELPNGVAASPLDKHLLDWQSSPFDYQALPGGDPATAGGRSWIRDQVVNRWPYASSYQATVYAWSPDTPSISGALPLAPAGDGTRIGIYDRRRCSVQRPMPGVVTPSHKAFMYEEFDFTGGEGVNATHYANPDATVAVQFFDGSVRRVTTLDANPGWDPRRPNDKDISASIRYAPIDTRYFPDDTALVQPNAGYYKWTRDGLRGVDITPASP